MLNPHRMCYWILQDPITLLLLEPSSFTGFYVYSADIIDGYVRFYQSFSRTSHLRAIIKLAICHIP